MNAFPKRSDLLVELHHAGQAFLEDVRTNPAGASPDNLRFCQLVPDPELKTDTGHSIVSELVDVPAGPEQISTMHQPVFKWNGSIREPIVSKVGRSVVNTSECFPPSLTLLATDYVDKGYGAGDTIYDQFVRKAGALFLCEATPRDFQIAASRDGVGLYFRDPAQPTVGPEDYTVKSSLFFKEMQQGNLPGFDVHDISHHASQMGMYDFYRWLASNATEEVLDDPTKARQRMLLNLVLLTTIEHSVVSAEDGVQSFGCLNWQSPRKSVLGHGVSNRQDFNLNDYPFGAHDFNQWSAIRAIASIYRGQVEAEEVLSTKLDWMRAMGYDMDRELLSIVRPFRSYDYCQGPQISDTLSQVVSGIAARMRLVA